MLSSRAVDIPPSIQVTFANGVKDEFDLFHYKMNDRSKGGCNYLGRLKNDPNSSVGVTGCLNKPGDEMEVTLLSERTKDTMFLVDFNKKINFDSIGNAPNNFSRIPVYHDR